MIARSPFNTVKEIIMKKSILFLLALLLLFSLCACGPKSFADLGDDEKSVITYVSVWKPADASGVALSGDPVAVYDTTGRFYLFIPVSFTQNGTQKREVLMCSDGGFVEYYSYQIPLGEIYSDDLSDARARQLAEIVRLKSIYDLVLVYGEKAQGRNVEDSVMIRSVTALDADDLTPILTQSVGK